MATGEFKDFKRWILANKDELKNTDLLNIGRPEQLFKITSKQEAMFAFRILAAEESLRVTSVIEVSNRHASNPTSVNPYLNKLILARLNGESYVGKPMKSRQLGLRLLDCIVPDEALLQISWLDILHFRNLTKDYFHAWSIELRRIEATLFSSGDAITNQDIINLVDSDINPKLHELKTEIIKIRDERFKNILKLVKNGFLSWIALGTLSTLSVPGAIAGFIGSNLKTPEFTDEIIEAHFKLKDKKTANGLTYLLKLQEYLKE